MRYDGHKIAVIIPALNEAKTISSVVRQAKLYADEIIVVDDGSSDATYHEAKTAGAYILQNKRNLGYEQSIERGFAQAKTLGAAILITMDADGQHKSEYLPLFINPIIENKADIVLGKRYGYKKRIVETLFAFYTKIRFGIEDPLCGLKAYRTKVYESIGHFDTANFIGAQLAIEGALRNFQLVSVPIQITPRKDTSRFYAHNLKANLKIIRATLKLSLHHEYWSQNTRNNTR